MKIQSKLFLISSAAVLSASPLAMADDQAASAPAMVICTMEEAVPHIAADLIMKETEGVDLVEGVALGEPTVSEKATESEVADTGEVTEVEVTADGEDPVNVTDGVPLDWVKRGGEGNPEIYYNMAGAGGPIAENSLASGGVNRQLAQDEKIAAVEAKGSPVSQQISGEKKETEAIVKQDRIFLR